MVDEVAEQSSRNGFKRVMLKLGGEMFGGGQVGIDPDVVENVAKQIAEVSNNGTEVCVCLLYTSPSPRDRQKSRMPSSA